MKHKQNEKVKVRKDLKVDVEYGSCTFRECMKPYLGTTQTIRGFVEDSYQFYGMGWCWSDEMLEDSL
jgi:hypothetical protein